MKATVLWMLDSLNRELHRKRSGRLRNFGVLDG